MSAKPHESRGSAADPSTDTPPTRVRDGSNPARDDEGTDTTNTPPNHRNPTKGAARFLYEVDPDTPVVELAAAYERWKASGDSEQTTVSRWSE